MSGPETAVWGDVSAKNAANASSWITPLLLPGERVEAIFECSSFRPMIDSGVLTNFRIVGVPSALQGESRRQAARSQVVGVRTAGRWYGGAVILELPDEEMTLSGVPSEVADELGQALAQPLDPLARAVAQHDLTIAPTPQDHVELIQTVMASGVFLLIVFIVWMSPLPLGVKIAVTLVVGLLEMSTPGEIVRGLRQPSRGLGLSDAEFDALVDEVEASASARGLPVEPGQFEQLVQEAIDELPDFMRQALEANVPVIVSDDGEERGAYGLYHGDSIAYDDTQDRIVIFRDSLLRDFGSDRQRLREEVRITLLHELAHHLGADEDKVREFGL